MTRDDAVRKKMAEAAKAMDALGEKLGAWDPTKIIRRFRDSRARRGMRLARPARAKTTKRRS